MSKVYLKAISCDLNAVEGWMLGKPEFKIKVAGMDISLKARQLQGGCDVQFASRTGNQAFTNVPIYNWSYFNDLEYYPTLTFSLEKYDSEKAVDIPITVAVGIKTSKTVEIDMSTPVNIHFENTGEYCRESSIPYVENPEQWLYFPNNSPAIPRKRETVNFADRRTLNYLKTRESIAEKALSSISRTRNSGSTFPTTARPYLISERS